MLDEKRATLGPNPTEIQLLEARFHPNPLTQLQYDTDKQILRLFNLLSTPK